MHQDCDPIKVKRAHGLYCNAGDLKARGCIREGVLGVHAVQRNRFTAFIYSSSVTALFLSGTRLFK